jgi:hypothetical protein
VYRGFACPRLKKPLKGGFKMIEKISGREKPQMYGKNIYGKSIVVGSISSSSKEDPVLTDEIDVRSDYENEIKLSSSISPSQGLSVGTGIGIMVCVLATIIGLHLGARDVAALVGIPAVVGMIAGYIFS